MEEHQATSNEHPGPHVFHPTKQITEFIFLLSNKIIKITIIIIIIIIIVIIIIIISLYSLDKITYRVS